VKQAARIHDWRVSRLLKHLKNDIDVVHGWPLGSLLTFRAARSLGITTFLERPNTHTGFAYEAVAKEMKKLGLQPPKGHSHTFDAQKLAQEEEEYNTADYLLAPSDFVKQTFLDNGFSPSKVVRHQYGCDTNRFGAPRDNRQDDRPLTAAFVGRCEPRKGLHYALQAWIESGAAENGRFFICGAFTPGYRELLSEWLEHPSVEILGFISDVAQVMRDSDILLLPSIEEGSALVTYEARACGCVLVVSDATGAVCEHMVSGLVHPAGDLDCLRDHLRQLSRDRDLLPHLRAKNLEGIDRLSWEYAGKRLADLYEICRS
jgi:glycosyltransferase involved in cell wall biosynthesis